MRSTYLYTPGMTQQQSQSAGRNSVRVTLTSPSRVNSEYDLLGAVKTPTDRAKPKLLNHVVYEEEMKGIVSRLTRPTMATRMRAVNFRPQSQYTFVAMNHYQWSRMSLYTDYQRQMYTNLGTVQPGFKRTVKATYRPVFC